MNGQIITIDGINRVIYGGEVPTKDARAEDLKTQFETIKVREWPNLQKSLPHLLHNKMVVEYENKYWRRTPTYPVCGFQKDLNLMRFAKVPEVLGNSEEVKINSKFIDGYTCCEAAPFEEYVALFNNFDIEKAEKFNIFQQRCIDEFIDVSEKFVISSSHWDRYIDTYAKLRAFIWLGDAYRSYANRKVDMIGVNLEVPSFYLDELSKNIQSQIPEIDSEMHREIYNLAQRLKDIYLPDNIEELVSLDNNAYTAIVSISKKYRFEHSISLDKEIDLATVYRRIKQEVENVKKGSTFVTDKKESGHKSLFPQAGELTTWLHLSIWNRILQSNAHQLDARARSSVRPVLIEFGNYLFKQRVIDNPEKIFELDSVTIGKLMEEYERNK